MKKIKEINRKIVIGVIFSIVFLILWLATFPVLIDKDGDKSNNKNKDAPLNNEEDVTNFNNAIVTKDNTFCNLILSNDLKEECLDKVAVSAHLVVEEKKTELEVKDITAYNNALVMKNSSFCADIINQSLRFDCLDKTLP